MRPFALLSLFFLAVLLTGCSSSFDSPNTVTTAPGQTSIGAISGKAYGGRQPIVGAQVYLFAAGTGGYGGNGIAASTSNASTSLITANASTTLDTNSSDPTYGDYYVTTDADGFFSLGGDYTCTPGTQVYIYATGGNPGAGTNTAASLMAVLGNCPSTDTLASQVPTVFMNEVSTVAAAYAIAGFASDAVHVSSSGTTLAQTGIKNAFANAAQLFDITNSVDSPNPVARSTTATGQTAPQTEANYLANILAACVNSVGSSSPACTDLFENATSNGSACSSLPCTHAPSETATAAINIAHNPASNVTALYDVPLSTVYSPALGAVPNDWTVAIKLTGSLSSPTSVAIDASGDAWVGNSASLVKFTQLGVATTIAPSGSHLNVHSVAIDASGNVWTTNGSYVTQLTSSGTLVAGFPVSTNTSVYGGLAIDTSGNAWYAANGANLYKMTPTGSISSGYSDGTKLNTATGTAIDTSGNVWAGGDSENYFVEFSSSGGALGALASMTAVNSVAIDATGNAWVAVAGGISQVTSSLTLVAKYTGGGVGGSSGVSIDGAGNIWTSNYLNARISELNSSGTAISPSTGYLAASLAKSDNYQSPIAVDGSGDVWVTCYTANTVYEFLGAASPVVTPLVANLISPYGSHAVNKP